MTSVIERPVGRPASRLGVLGEIADRRRADVLRELDGQDPAALRRAAREAGEPRDAVGLLLRPGLHLIAEVKRRSPSAGPLAAEGTDVVGRARAYEQGGAAVVSVLVERHWFGGSLDDLASVRAAIGLPVLAKDFVVDPRQLAQLRAAGADVVLLIAALQPAARLSSLVRQARSVGLEPLVEAHDERELERTLRSEARLIGLNNRDLRSLAVDPERAMRLRELVPDDRLVVAESGVREPADLRSLRAVGFDAALVGEALMAGAGEPALIRDRVAAFVAAGRPPSPAEDPAAADRTPTVKICSVTEPDGLLAAIRAGADAIGLNFVPGTRRCLDEAEGARLVRLARQAAPAGGVRLVGVFADQPPDIVNGIATRLALDAVQLSGDETLDEVRRMERPLVKVVHAPPAASVAPETAQVADGLAARVETLLAEPSVTAVMLDSRDATVAGGTGHRADPALAAALARRVPILLAGGLDAANVAEALRAIPAIGVDVASGVESRRATRRRARPGRPAKDPYLVGLFVKRAKAARIDRPQIAARPTPVDPGLVEADDRGRWGTARQFGGRYVPETLVTALVELEGAYAAVRHDPRFWSELRELGSRYVGRPSPLYRADRLAAAISRQAGREPEGLRLYLKREDLNHTGAHKITNALGQALLTRRLGKSRVIAETGAGQHGVATATACALLDLPCVVYMGAEDIRRQEPNVLRMRALGAEVHRVESGSATLKDAINEAMRDWVTNVATSHYVLGSAVGPHPYPTIVRDLQRVIGDEACAQLRAVEGRLPDAVVACLGGGSNAIGLFSRFIGEPHVRLVGVEAAGEGIASGRHAAALAGGSPGILHGARSYLLQNADGQVVEAHSISAGLDYPGIGPQLSALYAAGRMEVLASTDSEALDGLRLLTRTEGILPALEPAHAIAALPRLLARDAERSLPDEAVVLLGLSGRGDKDLGALEA